MDQEELEKNEEKWALGLTAVGFISLGTLAFIPTCAAFIIDTWSLILGCALYWTD